MNYVRDATATVALAESTGAVKADKADKRILEYAGRADYIISCDIKHLQSLKAFKGIPILSPAEFVKRFLE